MTKPANMKAHHWSGWPGAYCLKCGSEDPSEIALADGDMYFVDGPPSEDIMAEPNYVIEYKPGAKEKINAASICPVDGELRWNEESKAWWLYKADGTSALFTRETHTDGA